MATERDTGKFKLGDGAKAWKDLPYQPFWSRWGRIEGQIADQPDIAAALALRLLKSSNLSDLADIVAARANLGLKALALRDTVNGNDWNGADLAIADGGTGASTAPVARNNLGLGTAATANTGTDGAVVTLASGANIWRALQTFLASTVTGGAAWIHNSIAGPGARALIVSTADATDSARGFDVRSNNSGIAGGASVFSVGGSGITRTRNLNLSNLATYATDGAAGTAGLVAGDLYKTTTGELRIKL
ncbi:hypothetical protein [Sphingomonas aurantiaca]|uniref:hypothetical protein n=1 Tax=Sphingomonas aurantiaca TaxID=185949 RepID=UPI00125F9F25|nr:hypothetical protein [Sphingomonas aurantiaca]